MWICVDTGFYSAVVDSSDKTGETLQVRSRAKADAESLAKWIKEEHGVDVAVLSWKGRDYPYRVIINKDLWGSFLVAKTVDMQYGNFKNEVAKRNPGRAKIYAKVWNALFEIEDENPEGSNKSIYNRLKWTSAPSVPLLHDRDLLDDLPTEEEHAGLYSSIHDMTEDEWARFMEETP